MLPRGEDKQVNYWVCGAQGTGKTALINRYVDHEYTQDPKSHSNLRVTDNQNVKECLYEVSHNDLEQSNQKDSNIEGMDAAMIMVDLNNPGSFEFVQQEVAPRLAEGLKYNPNLVPVLIGTKNDDYALSDNNVSEALKYLAKQKHWHGPYLVSAKQMHEATQQVFQYTRHLVHIQRLKQSLNDYMNNCSNHYQSKLYARFFGDNKRYLAASFLLDTLNKGDFHSLTAKSHHYEGLQDSQLKQIYNEAYLVLNQMNSFVNHNTQSPVIPGNN